MRYKKIALFILLATGLALLTGCGRRMPAEQAELQAEPSTFLRLLGLVPDTAGAQDPLRIYINDLSAARRSLGLLRPGPEADSETLRNHIIELTTGGGMVFGRELESLLEGRFSLRAGLRDRAGYDLREVNYSIAVEGWGVEGYSAVALNVPSKPVMNKLLACSEWPPQKFKYEGISVLSWGQDRAVNFRVRLIFPIFNYLGQGSRLAFYENLILRTIWTDGVKQMIDAKLGNAPSLADIDELRLIAYGLTRLGVYSALLTNETQDRARMLRFHQASALDRSGAMLRPYQFFATGIGKDENGFFMGLVLAHNDAYIATQNIPLLHARLSEGRSLSSGRERHWNTVFDVEKMEIETIGRILLAKIPIMENRSIHTTWRIWFYNADPLLLHE